MRNFKEASSGLKKMYKKISNESLNEDSKSMEFLYNYPPSQNLKKSIQHKVCLSTKKTLAILKHQLDSGENGVYSFSFHSFRDQYYPFR
uniref:Uncharacterized protein n=1 Tax=Megaselia scalaris TaxID=36166 RepID=T1GCL0_MEGSC